MANDTGGPGIPGASEIRATSAALGELREQSGDVHKAYESIFKSIRKIATGHDDAAESVENLLERMSKFGSESQLQNQYVIDANENLSNSYEKVEEELRQLIKAEDDDVEKKKDLQTRLVRLTETQNKFKEGLKETLHPMEKQLKIEKRQVEVLKEQRAALEAVGELTKEKKAEIDGLIDSELRSVEATEGATEAAKTMSKMFGISFDLSETAVGRLALKGDKLRSSLKGFAGPEMKKKLGEYFTGSTFKMNLQASAYTALIQLSTVYFTALFKLAMQLDNVTAKVAQSTGTGRKFQSLINESAMDLYSFGLGMEEAGEAVGALGNRLSGFNRMSEETQESLVEMTAKMSAMGVSADSAVDMLNIFTKSMAMTEAQAEETMYRIGLMGEAIGAGPAEIMREYAGALPYLTQFGNRTEEVFIGLKGMAEATGVSFESLLALTKKMDTFAGAAEVAAQMNALMGMQLSTTELLNASSEERLDMLHREFKMTGRQFSQMGRFEQQLMANAAGFNSVAEAAMFFDSSMAEVTANRLEMRKAQADQEKFNEALKDATPMLQRLKTSFMRLFVSVSPLLDVMLEVVDGITMFMDFLGPAGQKTVFFTAALAGLVGVAGAVTLALGWPIAAVAALVAGLVFGIYNIGKMFIAFKEFGGGVKGFGMMIASFLTWPIQILLDLVSGLINMFSDLDEQIDLSAGMMDIFASGIGAVRVEANREESDSFVQIMEKTPVQLASIAEEGTKASSALVSAATENNTVGTIINQATSTITNTAGAVGDMFKNVKFDLVIDFGRNQIFREQVMAAVQAEEK